VDIFAQPCTVIVTEWSAATTCSSH